ncbi:MAG: ABC transporter substrate-binding protein [Anaerolineae bacterium]|nr:ABC transporter substrate-binding protein [Anaerolineae bacterium]
MPEPIADSNAMEAQNENQPPERATIRIGQLPYLSHAIFTIANEEGYFDEQGIDVEIISVKESNEIIPMLLAGEIDVSAPSPNAAFFNAITRGGVIKIILPLTDFIVSDCPAIAYLARKTDVDAGTWQDKSSWADATVVIAANGLTSIQGYVLDQAVGTAGLTVDEIVVEQLNLPVQEEALRTGQVDIVYAVEPWITRMTTTGDIGVLDPAEQYAPGLTASIVVAGPALLDNPELAGRFATAFLKAVRQYLEGATERNVAHTVNLTGMDAALVQQICWSSASPNGEINLESLLDYQNWLMERGLLDEVLDVSEFYDPYPAEYAVDELGRIE